MRVKVRRVLDTSKPINLRQLPPLDKIKAGIISQWQTTTFYKRNKQRQEEAEYMQMMQRDENLKSYLLAFLYRELGQNSTLSQMDKQCESVIITVNQQYEDSLKRLLPALFGLPGEANKDFISYDIVRVPENADIRRAFKEMPILLKCSKKHL